jgi:ubiquinone/menaquinone biosynthesis C-methylase UbiE
MLAGNSSANAIEFGIIACTQCRAEFPVIRHVPRLLKDGLLARCIAYYEEDIADHADLAQWARRHAAQLGKPGTISAAEKKKIATQKNFGYEWHVWKKLPDYAEGHFLRIMKKDAAFFNGKVGYDAATGMGRYLHAAALAVGEHGFMIGTDISFAVDMAYARCQALHNVLVVQADLYTDVIPAASLDFAFMIGLIQHLTEPAEGVAQVTRKIKPGGYFVGTYYTKPTDMLNKCVVAFIYAMRLFTTHLPLPVVLVISRICAVPAYLFFKLPQAVLNRFAYVREMNRLYPEHGTQNRRPDMDLLAHNWFDHFTPPLIRFFSDAEVYASIQQISFCNTSYIQGVLRATCATPKVPDRL